MNPETTSPKRYQYGSYEGYETRSRRRVQENLGVSAAAAETILHLRSQVIELQSHIRQVEAELAEQNSSKQLRLAIYREIYFEATWVELDFEE
jgi:hypothetical protein